MNKAILRLAIPNIISNISVPLLGLVDTYLMGQMESPIYLGAIAIAGIIFSFIYWGFGFLRMGTTGITAQASGRNDEIEIYYTLLRALFIAIMVGLLLIMGQKLVALIGFKIVGASSDIATIAKPYFFIRIWDAPAAIGLYALNGWFFGMQNARHPMIITITINTINIVLNYLFVFHYGMKANGVALGTVIAQYSGFVLAIVLFLSQYKHLLQKINTKILLKAEVLVHFFKVNFDIFLRTLCLIFTFSFFTAMSENEGIVLLAVNTILLQYLSILSYGIDGFAFAIESIAGKYYGMKNSALLQKSIRYSFYWGLGFALFYVLAFALLRHNIVSIFTDDVEVINAAKPFIWWLLVLPIPAMVAYIWDGIYIGLTLSKAMRNTMFVATFLLYLPIYFLLQPIIGNHALWLALVIFMFGRGLGLSLLAKRNLGITPKALAS